MSVQPEVQPWSEPQADEAQRHLELVASNEYPEPVRPEPHSNMANGDLYTWSTIPERDHTYYGVISYKEADGAKNGVPVRLYGEAAVRYWQAKRK